MPNTFSPLRTRSPRTAALALALASCSSLPEKSYPPFAEHRLAADYVVPADGRIRIPATTRDLVVRDLRLDPPPRAESFDADGTRWVLYDGGTRVHLRGSFRAYAEPGRPAPTPAQLLPGADAIEELGNHR